MMRSILWTVFALPFVQANLTLDVMRNLTYEIEGLRGRIVGLGDGVGVAVAGDEVLSSKGIDVWDLRMDRCVDWRAGGRAVKVEEEEENERVLIEWSLDVAKRGGRQGRRERQNVLRDSRIAVDAVRLRKAIQLGSDGEKDRDEVEEIVTAAVRILCSDVLAELEKPVLELSFDSQASNKTECVTIRDDYHAFLSATVRFIYAVQEKQMIWRWSTGSTVYDSIAWMQSLWASRRGNSQNRSFIEQQLTLYTKTGCFGKKSREVLRRDVEVVEYLNDLLDQF